MTPIAITNKKTYFENITYSYCQDIPLEGWKTGWSLLEKKKNNLVALKTELFILVGWDRSFLYVAWSTGVQLCSGFQLVIRRPGISIVGQLTESMSPGYHDLFVCP